uniref:tRNA pseudouridine synthase A n=1 Tax=Candidatus Kentrum sp. DK TaxID=2126562 RepID=A0A450SDZ8_9GAMM|nr:MAG: tRNA pseudouridine38-40 synthase [Candidatus Kentron sp. DK]
MRIALGIEYDGSGFSGWETQKNARTVQSLVEAALSRVANAPVLTVCAGRTDAGVHASAQVVHFETGAIRQERAWVYGANTNLPREISVLWANIVPDNFHARFSARSRHYRYHILNRPVRSALYAKQITWECRPLSVDRMRAGAGYLLGEHDFSTFRAAACQAASPIRTIHALEITRHGERIRIDVVANAFLHHMVRNIAGVLMAIGTGKREPEWAGRILAARDRTRGAVTAPAEGLYLAGVEYPEQFRIPRG